MAKVDENVLTGTRLLSRVVTEIYDTRLRPFDISAIQFALLELIGRTEPTTRAAIARTQQLEKSTLTRNLKAIFSKGWIEEVREQADGRSRPIALTEAGRQRMRDAASAWRAAQSEVEALLGREGLVAVFDGVERIARLFSVSGSGLGIAKPNGRAPVGD